MYYNIHTHSPVPNAGQTAVYSAYEHFGTIAAYPRCSVGLHPRYLEQQEKQWVLLEKAATAGNVIAIGECGLDTLSQWDRELQVAVFSRHIILAERLQKPLIIHCVKAFNECIAMLQQHKVTVPVVFHGFNKKEQLARQLLREGFYLSLGTHLLQDQSPARALCKHIDSNRLFLETDTKDNALIEKLYSEASDIRNCSLDSFISQIENNVKSVFKL